MSQWWWIDSDARNQTLVALLRQKATRQLKNPAEALPIWLELDSPPAKLIYSVQKSAIAVAEKAEKWAIADSG
jgi:hypothetical protein